MSGLRQLCNNPHICSDALLHFADDLFPAASKINSYRHELPKVPPSHFHPSAWSYILLVFLLPSKIDTVYLDSAPPLFLFQLPLDVKFMQFPSFSTMPLSMSLVIPTSSKPRPSRSSSPRHLNEHLMLLNVSPCAISLSF